jgi:protein O-GlcNAc transferase
MHRKALELYKSLGHKEGMAKAYNNLGAVYQTRKDLAQAEAMYRQALTLSQEIGATLLIEQARTSLDRLHVQGSR